MDEVAEPMAFTGPRDGRAEWILPEVTTMAAGSAENGAGKRGDDPVNFS